MEKNGKKANVNKLIIIIVSVVLVLTVIGVSLYLFVPVSIKVDMDAIEPVGTDVLVCDAIDGTHKAIYKPDGNGDISDQPFKILSFTDTHLDNHREKGAFTVKYMIENIYREKPDLIVFVGDMVTSSMNRARAKQFALIMEKLGIYWVGVLGNHEGDNARSISRKKFVEIYSSYPHCLISGDEKLTLDGEKVWGYGNTQIDILTKGGVVAQSLFFIDSGNEISKADAEAYHVKEGSTDFVKTSQIKWYEECVAALDQGVSSIMFLHIPLCEYAEALSDVPKKADGTFDYDVESQSGTKAVLGGALERVSCSEYNSGLFDAIIASDSTKIVVCGHDHVNNFQIRYRGITLCYNRCSGYSSYNAYTKNKNNKLGQGATLFTVNTDGTIAFTDIINGEKFDDSDAYKLYK